MPPQAPSGSGFFTQTQRYASAGPPVQHSDILDHLPPGAFGPLMQHIPRPLEICLADWTQMAVESSQGRSLNRPWEGHEVSRLERLGVVAKSTFFT